MRIVSHHKGLLFILLAAAAMAGYLLATRPNMGGDGLYYHYTVHNFFTGKGLTFNGQPAWSFTVGYGLLSNLLNLLVQDIEYSGMIVSALAYLGLIVLVHAIGGRLMDKRAALIPAGFTALTPALVEYSCINLTDVTAAFVLCFGLYTLLRYCTGTGTLPKALALGLALGLGYWMRDEGFIIGMGALGLVCLVALWGVVRGKGWKLPATFLAALSVFALLCVPGFWHIYNLTGVVTFSERALAKQQFKHLLPENFQEEESLFGNATKPEVPRQYRSIVPALINRDQDEGKNPVMEWLKAAKDIGLASYRMTKHASIPLVLCAVAGLFALRRRKPGKPEAAPAGERPGAWLVLACFAVYFLPFGIYIFFKMVRVRHIMQFSPYMILLMCWACHALLRRRMVTGKAFQWGAAALLGLSLVIASGILPRPYAIPSFKEVYSGEHPHKGLRGAGLWISEQARQGDFFIVAPKKSNVAAFYAYGKSMDESFMKKAVSLNKHRTLADVRAILREVGGGYFILDSWYIDQRPNLKPLWDAPDTAREYGLRLLHLDPDGFYQVYGLEQ